MLVPPKLARCSPQDDDGSGAGAGLALTAPVERDHRHTLGRCILVITRSERSRRAVQVRLRELAGLPHETLFAPQDSWSSRKSVPPPNTVSDAERGAGCDSC